MKYLAVIAGAVLVGFHWHSEWGWFIALIVAAFIINLLIDKENEKENRQDH